MHVRPFALAICVCTSSSHPAAQTTVQQRPPLRALSASVESLVNRVAPCVVQVRVTRYVTIDRENRTNAGVVIGREHAIGSGAIVSSDGYIVTNAHVVTGAQRMQVVLHSASLENQLGQFLAGDSDRGLDARIVGSAQDFDLALLKVEVKGLRAMPLADYRTIRQGELVFAFGSPEMLHNSVTMGVVSSIARQPDPDNPAIYIQTDAPINPGNSGGPLVNVDGELVGLNTFILSASGGSQGLGFAIPSAVVAAAYSDLRSYGHLRRGILGIDVQANSPELAEGLHLAKTTGVLVSDIMPGGVAEGAGLQPGDILLAINGVPISTVPVLGLEMLAHKPGDTVTLELLRDAGTIAVSVAIGEEPDTPGRLATLANPAANTVSQLGIVGIDITHQTAGLLPDVRLASGVFVAARSELSALADNPLTAGDIVHAVNTFAVRSLDGLRVILDGFKRDATVVLQIERGGRFRYITMRLE